MQSMSKRFLHLILPIGAIILLWALIITKVFTFSFYDNEYDILPYARQDVQPEWLPGDWYLNLEIGYRGLFNLLAGNLVTWFGFDHGAYLSRLLGYLAIAIGWYFLFRATKLRFSLGILSLFVFLKSQSLIAGEWMVAGAETKTFAYALIFLALVCFLQKKYLTGFIFSGLAASFHVLVGFYALFCAGFAILLSNDWRSEWRKISLNAWPFLITGIVGLQSIANQLFSNPFPYANQAWEIYVTYRVPHHVYPESWEGGLWIARLGLGMLVFALIFSGRTSKSATARFVSAYGLASTIPFLAGLVIYAAGKISLLRFYWFRFPDTMVPFLTSFLLAYLANEILTGQAPLPGLSSKVDKQIRPWLERSLQAGVTAILLISLSISALRLNRELDSLKVNHQEPLRTTLAWIAANTPKQAIFLIDPGLHEFYIYAERPVFVTWKNSPQQAEDLFEWYQRIKLCNGNRTPEHRSYASTTELRTNFYQLGENEIRQIASQYHIDYYLGKPQQNLSFEIVYRNAAFTVYKIGQN